MELVPLHHCKEFTESCTEILNSFWPRSVAAREHSLHQSCDSMPISLVLINRQHNKDAEVIGYSRIAAVQGILQACLVESVIIREVDRGKGFGRVLMQLTEDFARNNFKGSWGLKEM
ncbi:N-alpha-acetyltransferase 80-like isoform X2 [Physella acuta]|uniref:N-alpha-acetyltransferase 80-like isoform X2 n=1 Tax=Physella acuta TaxID=109671 RepID=UPI0027DC923B|nr:N-alpha-acetyltransferase 80-like isoform X2 [Physella acuta]